MYCKLYCCSEEASYCTHFIYSTDVFVEVVVLSADALRPYGVLSVCSAGNRAVRTISVDSAQAVEGGSNAQHRTIHTHTQWPIQSSQLR